MFLKFKDYYSTEEMTLNDGLVIIFLLLSSVKLFNKHTVHDYSYIFSVLSAIVLVQFLSPNIPPSIYSKECHEIFLKLGFIISAP